MVGFSNSNNTMATMDILGRVLLMKVQKPNTKKLKEKIKELKEIYKAVDYQIRDHGVVIWILLNVYDTSHYDVGTSVFDLDMNLIYYSVKPVKCLRLKKYFPEWFEETSREMEARGMTWAE